MLFSAGPEWGVHDSQTEARDWLCKVGLLETYQFVCYHYYLLSK